MSIKKLVNNLIQNENVIVFSKTYCPYCAQTKKLFKKLKCPIKIVELDTIKNGNAVQNCLYEISHQKTVPNTFIKGKHIGGNDKLQLLHKKGELLPLIEPFIIQSKL
ncbi:glutaredoxin-1 [Neocallimastix lanati (nom. inval.)]|uniref:Glutaredoxin-1 n=1 Tax=Neocallimastix californiae TaxID=1754190 RepID=A0A1Y2DEN4_9FUNG|nr:glutaredoxin-1 [Neocallimastix sp. JGI-2020a]ORY57667.1 glutaredoxin-1 [Neocallimastix californiae]|eukprot:ORY57667.1 glutaredoxin-1 [Neocallimastix californiae]